mgnify:CR=1 FL=1
MTKFLYSCLLAFMGMILVYQAESFAHGGSHPTPWPTPPPPPGAANNCAAGRWQSASKRYSLGRVERDRKAGAKRVIRGGSWNNKARNCRCASRNRNHPENRNDNLGFRPARAHDRVG